MWGGGDAGEDGRAGSGDEDFFVVVACVEEDGLGAPVVRSARVKGGEVSVLRLSRRHTFRPFFSDREHPFGTSWHTTSAQLPFQYLQRSKSRRDGTMRSSRVSLADEGRVRRTTVQRMVTWLSRSLTKAVEWERTMLPDGLVEG